MPAERYHVIFKGEIADGEEITVVKDRLVALFKVPRATVDKMFQGASVKLKKNVDHSTAQKYQAAVERTGARCHLLAVEDTAPPSKVAEALGMASATPAPARPSLAKDSDADSAAPDTGEATNFYAPPGATLTEGLFGEQPELNDPRRVPVGHALRWLSAAFEMFKVNPLIWIVLVVLWFAILMFLSLIPLLSLGVNFLVPILTGGLMLGCRDLDEGEPLQVGHLFAAFQGTGGRLAALGGLQLLAMFGLAMAVGLLMFSLGAGIGLLNDGSGFGGQEGSLVLLVSLVLLITLALGIPITMGFWFAPVLVVVHDVPVLESVKLSFVGCLRNLLPFLVYGLVVLVLFFIALIPLGLGLLVMGPVIMASLYTSHKDIYMSGLD